MDSVDLSLSKLRERAKDKEVGCAAAQVGGQRVRQDFVTEQQRFAGSAEPSLSA